MEEGPFEILQHLPRLVTCKMVSLHSPCHQCGEWKEKALNYSRIKGPARLQDFKISIGPSEPLAKPEHTLLSDLF